MKITDISGQVTLSNGVAMPYLGLGVYKAKDGQEVIDAAKSALKVGYRLIDTASFYGNEQGVGKAVRESDVEREHIFVTSKVWNSDHGYDKTLRAFENSLHLFGFDYLDLYLIHWPVKGKFKDTWRALEGLYREGRVRAIGVSNFLRFQLEDLMDVATFIPMVNQMEFSPYLVQQDLLTFCQENDIRYEAWSPLMQGKVFKIPELQQLSSEYQKTIAQVVLRWNLQKGVVTIPKSVHYDRILENASLFDFELTPDDMKKIDCLDRGFRMGPDPADFNF